MSSSLHISQICGETRWKPYHELLAKLEERIRKILEAYTKGECAEETCQPIVIVAPYGSGKTELAKHICNWGWKQNIPVLIVNLSHIYVFLYNLYEKMGRELTEVELVESLKRFFDYTLSRYSDLFEKDENIKKVVEEYSRGKIRGVLIVDEIEETYDAFRKIMHYKTTPWRAVFDATREGRLPFIPILLYGPSSELDEAIHMSGAWRALVFSIPILPPSFIEQEFLKDTIVNPNYRKLLANMLFWLGRGRIGLVTNLLNNQIARITISKLEKLSQDKSLLERTKHFWAELEELLRREIVENITIFDEISYERHLSEVDPAERDLLKVLITLVGPIPERELSKIFDINRVMGLRLRKIVRSRTYVSKSALVNEIVKIAERISKGKKDLLVYLESIIDNVFEAWSYNDIIILPIEDKRRSSEPLNWLKEVASAIAFEMYRPEVAEVLDKIDIENVVDHLRRAGFVDELEENYYAVHPQVLIDVYTPIAYKPLIGCSRWATKEELISNVMDYISSSKGQLPVRAIENLAKYVRDDNLKKFLRERRVCIHVLPEQNIEEWIVHTEEHIVEEIEAILSKRYGDRDTEISTHVVLILPTEKSPDELKNTVQSRLKHLVEIGLVTVPETSMRLSAFLQGFMNYMKACPEQSLTPLDEFILTQYANALAMAVSLSVADAESRRSEVSGSIRKLEQEIKSLSYLKKQRGHVVGEEQARYFYLLATAPDTDGMDVVKSCLANLMERLKNTRKALDGLIRSLDSVRESIEKEELTKSLFKDIRLLAETGAQNYYETTRSFAEEVNKRVREGDFAIKTTRSLIELIARGRISKNTCNGLLENDTILKLLEDLFPVLEVTRLMYYPKLEPLAYAIAVPPVITVLNDVCLDLSYKMSVKLGMSTANVNSWFNKLSTISSSLSNEIDELIDLLGLLGVSIERENIPIIRRLKEFNHELRNFVNMLETLVKTVVESSEKLRGEGFAANKIFEETVLEMIVKKLVENSEQLIFHIEDTLTTLDRITGLLRKIVNRYDDLEREKERVKNVIGDDIIASLTEDLKTIFGRSAKLDELNKFLEKYVSESYIDKILETIREESDILSEQERLRREFEILRKIVENL